MEKPPKLNNDYSKFHENSLIRFKVIYFSSHWTAIKMQQKNWEKIDTKIHKMTKKTEKAKKREKIKIIINKIDIVCVLNSSR